MRPAPARRLLPPGGGGVQARASPLPPGGGGPPRPLSFGERAGVKAAPIELASRIGPPHAADRLPLLRRGASGNRVPLWRRSAYRAARRHERRRGRRLGALSVLPFQSEGRA